MNIATVTTGTTTHTTTINNKTYKIEMVDDSQLSVASDDEEDDIISSDGSMYGDGDIVQMSLQDDVANQLAAAGPVGVAAAAAIASSKKRRRPHSFETNPSVRKRQQNRLLRKLRGIIYEFTGRVGKQAVVLVATPGKPNTSYKVFGAKPLEDVVRNLKNIVMDELENALAQQAPPPPQEDPTLFELPPLIIDGIPTPVEKMTQAQLRAFIPLMLKYSTGRGKPGWGRESTRPPWWPKELPWANVRMDARSEDDKQKISWTHALRKIVINCYKYHGREDLLPTFADEDDKVTQIVNQATMDAGSTSNTPTVVTTTSTTNNNHYTQTVLSTIQNADGTVSLIQVDPNNPIITLPDGTTAQVQGVATLHQGEGGATIQTVQSLTDVNGHENMTVDLTEATVAQDGQIYITAEDGQGYPVAVSNMITVPVSASMYQSMIANIQQLHTNSDGAVCITPMQCYSITSSPAVGQRQTMPPATPTTMSTVANSRCQIFSSTLSNNSSHQPHELHHNQAPQSRAKVYLTNSSNSNPNSNPCKSSLNANPAIKSHNNNNTTTLNKNTAHSKNTFALTSFVVAGSASKRNKRRKQSVAKSMPVKLGDTNAVGLLNIQIVNAETLPSKAIKVENLEK